MNSKHASRHGPRPSLAAVAAAAALALAALASPSAAATQFRVAPDARLQDLGVAPPDHVKAFLVSLAVRDQPGLDALLARVADPKSADFRHFLTPAQFAARFGQPAEAVARVTDFLRAQGFTIDRVHANRLLVGVTGTNTQITAAFGVPMHRYAFDGGLAYEAPAGAPVLPAALAPVVTAVSGLSSRAIAQSNRAVLPRAGALADDVPALADAPRPQGGNPPGAWTVQDFAAKYHVDPLYARGLDGAGTTIGIVTLAGYDPADAYAYWNALGLPVAAGRLTDVAVDGGALPGDGPGSEGSGETTLDIEQAGGLAPGAAMRVYIGPNANAGFLDAFAQAVDENQVDVLSVSWGSPEIGSDPGTLGAFHIVFEQAALQGIPVIAAAGDAGAFDVNRGFGYPACTTLLSVDHPAADPLVLAAGGTTLPHVTQHLHGPVVEPDERPWSWDYLQGYILRYYGQAMYYGSYYTVGGGGGVSVDFGVPPWQAGLKGVRTSAGAQSLWCGPALPGAGLDTWVDLVDLPAGVHGRNLPDLALNADPYSGYAIYQGGWSGYGGGTSFVAPQLNGVLALISGGLAGHRIGEINPQLYAAFAAQGYGPGSPFRPITVGDNPYYRAAPNYNPATGLGSLDVAALAAALGVQ